MFNILDNVRKIANEAHANVVEMAHTLAAEFQEEEGEDEPSTSSKGEPAGKAVAKVKSGASHVIETIDKAARLLPPTDSDTIFVDLIATLIRQKNSVDPQLDKWLKMYNQWKIDDDSSKFEELRAKSEDLIQTCSNGPVSPNSLTDISLDDLSASHNNEQLAYMFLQKLQEVQYALETESFENGYNDTFDVSTTLKSLFHGCVETMKVKHRKINKLEEKLSFLAEQNLEKDEEFSKFLKEKLDFEEKILAEANQQITDLKNELLVRDRQIKTLTRDNLNKDEDVQDLKDESEIRRCLSVENEALMSCADFVKQFDAANAKIDGLEEQLAASAAIIEEQSKKLKECEVERQKYSDLQEEFDCISMERDNMLRMLTKLHNDVETLQIDCTTKEREIHSLEDQVDFLKKNDQLLKDTVDKCTDYEVELDRINQEMNLIDVQHGKDISDLQKIVAALKSELQDAQREIHKKNKEIKILENLKNDNNDLENIKVLHDKAEENLKQLQVKFDALQNQLSDMKQDHENEVDGLVSELKDVRREVGEKDEKIKGLENPKSDNNELENIKILHDMAEENLKQLQIKFDELQSQMSDIKEQYKNEVDGLKSKLQDLQRKVDEKDEQIKLLENLKNDDQELENIKILHDVAEENLKQLQIKFDELQSQMSDIKEQHKNEVDGLKSKLHDLQRKVDEKDEQIKGLKNDNNEFVAVLRDTAEENLKQFQVKFDALQSQMSNMNQKHKSEVDGLLSELQVARREIGEKDEQIKGLKYLMDDDQELKNIKVLHDKAEENLKQLQVKFDALQNQLSDMKQDHENEVDGLKRQIDNVADQRNSLAKRCNDNFEELKVKAEEMNYWKQYSKDANCSSEKFQTELIDAHQKIADLMGDLEAKDAALLTLQEASIEKERLVGQLNAATRNFTEISVVQTANEHLIKRNEELMQGFQQIQKQLFEVEQNNEMKRKEVENAEKNIENYMKNVEDLTKQLELVKIETSNDSEIMKEKFIQQINKMEDKISQLSKENEILKRDLHLANADLHAAKEAIQKYQNHIEILKNELTTKEVEITEIAAELSTNEHDLKVASSDSTADMEQLRKLLDSSEKEIKYITKKNEELRRNLIETQKDLDLQKKSVATLTQEKTILTTKFDDVKENYAQLKIDFERLNNSDRSKNSAEVLELRKKLESMEITVNVMKQAFKTMYYDERDQHQMFSLLVSLLEFDAKTSEIMLKTFDKNKKKSLQHFGPGLLEQFDKFVDKEITVNNIQLSQIPQPAFAIPIDEPLERQEVSENLKDILEGMH